MNLLSLILLAIGTCLLSTEPVLGAANDSTIVENSYALSTAGMAQLLHMEDELLTNLKQYADAVKEKLGILRLVLDQLHSAHNKSSNDPEAYLSNPLNSFALMRRMHNDWHKWQAYMSELVGKAQIEFMEQLQGKLPTEKDLKEASAGIFRIQETYELKATDMVRGYLNGRQYRAQLTALDCLAIGDYLNEQKNCARGISWYGAALESFSAYEFQMFEIFNVSQANILYLMADCWLESNNNQKSLALIDQAIAQKPDDEILLTFKSELKNSIKHDKLCRNEISQMSRLHCHYNSTTTPFLKLAPLKLEEIAMDPYIVLYHNVITESEIDEIQTLAIESMGRAGTSEKRRDPERTVNAYNMKYDSGPTGMRLYDRLLDMTGLKFNIKKSMLHVANYGLGGHYYNHVDYAPNENATNAFENQGNRIASVLFYLSNVDQGGETAFANLNKLVHAQKGSAIHWYHLDKAGMGNPKSMHASCPVIFGSKWMGITSTFINDQMFIKPCAA